MKRNWLLTMSLAATTALGALTLPALAHEFERGEGYGRMEDRGEHGGGSSGQGSMMDMMRQMHGMQSGMMGGSPMMGGRGMMMGGSGPGGGMGPMGSMVQAFDTDGDGSLTSEELRKGLEDRLAEYDADGSGSLSIDEFEALHSAMIREMMVDRFQALDNDGDGQVTTKEMTAPADRLQRMRDLRTRMMEQRRGQAGAGQPQNGMPMQDKDSDNGMMGGDDMMQQDETAEPGGN